MSKRTEQQKHVKDLVRYAHKFSNEFRVSIRTVRPIHKNNIVGVYVEANSPLGTVDASVRYDFNNGKHSAKKNSLCVILALKSYIRDSLVR